MTVDKTLLRHLLWIDGSWEISDYQIDLRRRRCDVYIGPQVERGWFGRPKAAAAPSQRHVWQHVALGEIRFHLHVTVPEGRAIQGLHWTGAVGEPFTAALAQQVFVLFNEGLTLQAICSTLKLSLNDVWRYRYALDHGRARVQQKAAAAAEAPRRAAAAQPVAGVEAAALAAGERSENVPDVADPVWLRLASGDLQLDIRVLSLKLMLTRVRSHLELISDDEVKLLKLRELHRYFVKNERVLAHELNQLRTA